MSTEHDRLVELDREARRAAQEEFVRPLVVEAGAGTGKTTTLVARVLAWALGPGWRHAAAEHEGEEPDRLAARVMEGVVAITFTEAAAAEMESRLAAGLALVGEGREDELPGFEPELTGTGAADRPGRARALLGALDHLKVSTIHAFCRGLLTAHPVAAGLHPELRVDADFSLLDEAVYETVERGIKRAFGGSLDEPLGQLAVRRIGTPKIAEAVRQLAAAGVSRQALERDPFPATVVDSLVAEVAAGVKALEAAAGSRLGPIPGTTRPADVARAVTGSRWLLEEQLSGTPLLRAEALAAGLRLLWSEASLNHLKKWSLRDFGQREAAHFGDAAEPLAAAAATLRPLLRRVTGFQPLLLDLGRRAVAELLGDVHERLRAGGIATFSALLIEARDLLRGRAAVRRRERRRIRQLLVDEFQDTDSLQCDLVRALALEGPEDERPGLFVVGDPKQSIYGWRDADLEAYEAFAGDCLAAGGRRLSLTRNFRSAPPILAEVDRVIRHVMIAERGIQPPYQALVAARDRGLGPGFHAGRWAAVEHWVAWQDETGPETAALDAAQLEAEAVAADIRALHDTAGVGWGEFGILLRSTSKLDTFLGALRATGVPFAVSRDKQYYRRREIIEAAALVRAVVHPTDHLALLTWLRSAAVGVPDGALIPLWARELPRLLSDLSEPDPRRLAVIRKLVVEAAGAVDPATPGLDRIAGWEHAAVDAITTLARLRGSFANDPPDRFIERLRRATLFEGTEAARYLGRFRLANLDRFFRSLRDALAARGGDAQAVLRALKRAVRQAAEAEEALPKDAAGDAVQVLTIHAAKGLEFGHVYLPQLHAGTGGFDGGAVDFDGRRSDDGALDYKLFGASTPGFTDVEARRTAVDNAERVRTLYVAMTRARERLVLSALWKAEPQPVAPDAAWSHLDLLSRREPLPSSIDGLFAGDRDPFLDAAEARWVHAGRLDKASRAAPAETPPPNAARVAAESAALRARVEQARARMARPAARPASAEAAERLDELFRDSAGGAPPMDGSRAAAMAVGTAIHRMFETWDLSAEPAGELERGRARVERFLGESDGGPAPEALERARELLRRFAEGTLFERLRSIAPRVVGREVPVMLPPGDGDADPVGFTAGAVDLIYSDSEGERLVIVDFKTDLVATEEEIERRAHAYQPQEALYARALRESLGLAEFPATELWFLWPDRLWSHPQTTDRGDG